ncbi:S24 family peptidase [Xenorhabdus stockiae]|uniref:S24 family peptidase n=1 Tax=Xenorhabdus stockiae TaxID=351614 RepID=UPI004063CA3B
MDHNSFKLSFAKATLRKIGEPSDSSTIICFLAKGDSMEPVIPDVIAIGIDTSNKIVIDSKVYIIEKDGLKRLKCLYRRLGGRSYN